MCCVANAASGAFGAIGIPVGIVDTLHLPGHVTAMGVSQTSTLTLAIINFFYSILINCDYRWLQRVLKNFTSYISSIYCVYSLTRFTYCIQRSRIS